MRDHWPSGERCTPEEVAETPQLLARLLELAAAAREEEQKQRAFTFLDRSQPREREAA